MSVVAPPSSRRKKFVAGVAVLSLVLAGIAIFTGDSNDAEVSAIRHEPDQSNTLAVSGPWEPASIAPSKHGHIYTRMQVIETLINVDANGQLIPGLARQWQVSEDALTWTLVLEDGVHFHDGTLMTAKAVTRSLHQAMTKHGALRKAPVESIRPVATDTIEIRLSRPYTPLGAILAHYSSAILAPEAFNIKGEVVELLGTGAYTLHTHVPPHKFMVKRFADYWGQKGQIEYASYLTSHRAESRVLQAKSGEADIVSTIDPATLPQLDLAGNVSVRTDRVPRTMLIKVNAGHPFLKDVRAREALSLALDRTGIVEEILRAPGTETDQVMPASQSAWYLADRQTPARSLEKASQLLAELGWNMNEQGVLEREGQVFEVTMMTYSDRPELVSVATAIQDQWQKMGVALKVDVTNAGMIPAGHQDGSLDMALIARKYGVIADPLGVLLSDFAEKGGDWGAMNWQNQTVTQNLNALQAISDSTAYHARSQEVASIFVSERPMIPVAAYSQRTAINKRVKGFRFDPFERSLFINEMELVQE